MTICITKLNTTKDEPVFHQCQFLLQICSIFLFKRGFLVHQFRRINRETISFITDFRKSACIMPDRPAAVQKCFKWTLLSTQNWWNLCWVFYERTIFKVIVRSQRFLCGFEDSIFLLAFISVVQLQARGPHVARGKNF